MTSTVIGRILPPSVTAYETFVDEPAELFPSEKAAVSQAVATRQREFGTGRTCARRALARLGVPRAPIGRDERGAPMWPIGTVGSITHCDNYRAAAVGWARQVRTIGIDAEPHEALPDGLLSIIARTTEQHHLLDLERVRNDVHWGRLLFTIKESVYKAWYPLTRQWLGFEQAEISMNPRTETFHARLLVQGVPDVDGFDGRWTIRNGVVVTAISLAAR